jgi:hypothetical protein
MAWQSPLALLALCSKESATELQYNCNIRKAGAQHWPGISGMTTVAKTKP